MAYTNGNLALQEQDRRQDRREVRYRETKQTVRRKVAIPAGEKFLYLFTIVLCAAVAGTILWKSTQIYEVNTKIQQIEYEIEQLSKENSTLKVEVRQMREPKRLIEQGKMLGLIPSDEDVIQQVSADKVYRMSRDSELAIKR